VEENLFRLKEATVKKNKLFSTLAGTGIVFFFSLTGLAKETLVESRWAATPPKVDGLNKEWVEDALSFEKSAAVDYAFKNDGRDLYVLFVFKDPKYLSSIEATGITLYFSTEGKKQKDYGVRFIRKTVSPDELIATLEKQGTTLTEQKKHELKATPKYGLFEAEAVDKKGEVIPPAGATPEADPPAFRMMKQDKLLVYEFRVPLAAREIHPAGIGSEPGKTIKVGFEWGGMTEEMRKAMVSRMDAEGTRAGESDVSMGETVKGGDENEGMRDSGSSLAQMRRGPKKHSFWVDVKLAQAQ
jgi:hypothetical protein